MFRSKNKDQSSSFSTSNPSSNSTHAEKSSNRLAVQGVYFKCPNLGPEILSRNEWKNKIQRHLEELLKTDKSMASCLMIHSLNKLSDSKICIQTLCSILNNIVAHPNDDKYKKIRVMNKIFIEKVSKIIGAVEFLESVGFIKMEILLDSTLEDHYVYPLKNPDIVFLNKMIDLLTNTDAINLELHRNVKVLNPAQNVMKIELPQEFYIRTPDEIRREQLKKLESLENSKQLRTKEMRERNKPTNINKYRYTLIRVRFPDGFCLQATFGVFEKLKTVKDFIRKCIIQSVKTYTLKTGLGLDLPESDDDKSLEELDLVPAVLLTFVPSNFRLKGKSILLPEVLQSQ